jgi:Resolvase, N terminal domain
MSDKVRPTHLDRRAVVDLRQSDPKQVRAHRESPARQYALHERAVALGWPAERVQVIDEDLGQSGTSAQWRRGFQGLADDVAHGRVGAIFGLEVARLARSSADCHRLLELCGLAAPWTRAPEACAPRATSATVGCGGFRFLMGPPAGSCSRPSGAVLAPLDHDGSPGSGASGGPGSSPGA